MLSIGVGAISYLYRTVQLLYIPLWYNLIISATYNNIFKKCIGIVKVLLVCGRIRSNNLKQVLTAILLGQVQHEGEIKIIEWSLLYEWFLGRQNKYMLKWRQRMGVKFLFIQIHKRKEGNLWILLLVTTFTSNKFF